MHTHIKKNMYIYIYINIYACKHIIYMYIYIYIYILCEHIYIYIYIHIIQYPLNLRQERLIQMGMRVGQKWMKKGSRVIWSWNYTLWVPNSFSPRPILSFFLRLMLHFSTMKTQCFDDLGHWCPEDCWIHMVKWALAATHAILAPW